MVFWLIAAVLLLGTLAFLILPLLQRPGALSDRSRYEAVIYRDQLAEIDRELERGLIGSAEAEAARMEVSRRLLTTEGVQEDETAPMGRAKQGKRAGPVAGIAVSLLLPAAAIALYLHLGTPEAWDPAQIASAGRQQVAAEHQVADMSEAVQRLAARLEENPDDLDGWILLARSFTAVSRFREAAEAYEAAIGLAEGDTELRSAYGEVLVLAAGGVVPPRAREAFETVLSSRPGDPRSRYYLGVAEAQAGHGAEAIRIWQALQADSPAGAPWLPAVQQQIERTAQQYGIPVPAGQPPVAELQPGPGATDPHRGAEMPASEQDEMIRAMVARLAARLEDDPDDLQGWLRLARSYQVLGEPELLREALADAAAVAQRLGGDAPQTVEQARRSMLPAAEAAAPAAGQTAALSNDEQEMVGQMITRLAARLEAEPDDVAGWLQLGRSYAVLDEPAKARAAYTEALTRQPGNLALLQSYADTTLETGAEGAVNPLPEYSLTVLRNLLAVDAGSPQALWLLGLAEAGAGEPQAAADLWRRLLGGLEPGSQRFRAVALQIDRLGAR